MVVACTAGYRRSLGLADDTRVAWKGSTMDALV